MYAMKLVVEELVYGSRVVVTNLAINLPGLNEYIQKTYPHLFNPWLGPKVFSLHDRLRVLTDEETGVFWTIRGYYDAKITRCSKGEWQIGMKPSYAGVRDGGVFYAIDEVHNFFNARAWMETGRDVLHYLSQHRKLGDTVLAITQAVENVDKQFRSVTQDYTYLRNLKKEKMGLFKMPSVFVRKTYGAPATPQSTPMETGTFMMDCTGIGQCYDTAQGVGIHNRGNADREENRKGIPWWVFVIGLPVVAMAIFIYVPKIGAHVFFPGVPGVDRTQTQTNSLLVKPEPVKSQSKQGLEKAEAKEEQRGVEAVLKMTGWAKNAEGKWTVLLSDGSMHVEGDGHLTFLAKTFCIVDGKQHKLASLSDVRTDEIERAVRAQKVEPLAIPSAERSEPAKASEIIVFGQRKPEPERMQFQSLNNAGWMGR